MSYQEAFGIEAQDSHQRGSTTECELLSARGSRRQSLRDTWKSIKVTVSKKRGSLPDFPVPNIFRSTSPAPSPVPAPQGRPEDIEESGFCDCLMEVMQRNPRYHKYLCESTIEEGRRKEMEVEVDKDQPKNSTQSE